MSDLISRSELTESIKRQYCTGCDNYNGSRCRACHADDMLSLVDDTADAQRWISVEEKLPDKLKRVLVFKQRNGHALWHTAMWDIEIDWRGESDWSKNSDNGWFTVTHWMPLPEPPKEPEA